MLGHINDVYMKGILRHIVVQIITWEARLILKKYKPRIIAVTGSVGKTSTKDIIFAALAEAQYVRKSKKSFNSEIGVPLTILGCETGWNNPIKWGQNIVEGLALILLANHYPRWLVIEVGTDRPGDIRALAQWLKPDIVVLTALPDIPVHVENFSEPEDVTREKKALAHALKSDGTLIINGDDKQLQEIREEFKEYEILSYGVELHNDISASHISIEYDENNKPIGMKFRVEEEGSSIPMLIYGRLGKQQIYPVLSAFTVAKSLGLAPLRIAKILEKEVGPRGRMRILEGHNNTTIIDDSYNSSPAALRAALSTLKKITCRGKKIAVLGDMLELGKFSAEAHKKAGVQVASVADVLITVGVRAKGIAQAAREAGFSDEYIQEFETGDAKDAGRVVRAMLEDDDVVLVKGSQSGIRLEKAIKEMLKEPARARDLLVRQEDAWLES